MESDRGLIKVNRETYQTTAPDVFACGDIAHGPRLFIDAIASAQIAARSMHDFLRGTRTEIVVRSQWMPAAYTMAEGWERIPRSNPPVLDATSAPARSRSSRNRIPRRKRTARRRAACAATSTQCSIPPSASPATAVWTFVRRTSSSLVGLSELCKEERWLDMVSASLEMSCDELRAHGRRRTGCARRRHAEG